MLLYVQGERYESSILPHQWVSTPPLIRFTVWTAWPASSTMPPSSTSSVKSENPRWLVPRPLVLRALTSICCTHCTVTLSFVRRFLSHPRSSFSKSGMDHLRVRFQDLTSAEGWGTDDHWLSIKFVSWHIILLWWGDCLTQEIDTYITQYLWLLSRSISRWSTKVLGSSRPLNMSWLGGKCPVLSVRSVSIQRRLKAGRSSLANSEKTTSLCKRMIVESRALGRLSH